MEHLYKKDKNLGQLGQDDIVVMDEGPLEIEIKSMGTNEDDVLLTQSTPEAAYKDQIRQFRVANQRGTHNDALEVSKDVG